MTQNEHKPLIVELAKLFKPKVYVELGVGSGYVFNAVLPYVREYALGIDIELHRFAITKFSRLREKYPKKLFQIGGITTDEAVKYWPGNCESTIDLLFIDADHSAEQVRKDFITWSKFVTPGTGLILLHDTYPINAKYLKPGYCNDAWKVADEIYEDINTRHKYNYDYPDFEIVTLPGPHAGLSIIRKRGKHHLHWMESE